ncbi:PspC domain-containing protein [Microbacterium sp. F2]|uniref:PspC domain-containing protein n=1 Tax=Microbacterium sp. F2 TaxID=3422228 RepID=UPI003FD2B52C
MSTSTEPPATDPGPPPPRPTGAPTGADRFFAWVRGLGVVRADGWLGGVCAGIAARIRVDAAIVRGIVVVAAVLGFPMLLLYAIAWALLPDVGGRIHLREATRGRFDPAMVAIIILLVVGFVPVVPWFGWMVPGWNTGPLAIIGWIVGSVLAVALVILVVRASARPATGSGASPTSASEAASEDIPATDAVPTAPPAEPLPPERGAGNAEIAEWRARHDAWRAENDAWRRSQKDADRLARDQARREREAEAAAFATAANEKRRIRRLSRPRASGAFVVSALGVALVAGAGTAIWHTAITSVNVKTAGAYGLFVAALVLAVSMIVAGLMRRRSGFLAFATVVALFGGTVAATIPPIVTYASEYQARFHITIENSTEPQGVISQEDGELYLTIQPLPTEQPPPLLIRKGDGYTTITVVPGVALDLNASLGTTEVWYDRWDEGNQEHVGPQRVPTDDNGRLQMVLAYPQTPVQTTQRVVLDQDSGQVYLSFTNLVGSDPLSESSPEPLPTLSPLPAP